MCAITASPDNARAHDDPAGPIAELTRLIRVHPDSLPLYLERAELRRIARDYDGAARDHEAIATRRPDYPGLDLCRAALATDRGDGSGALRLLDAALATRPEDTEAHRLRAEARLAAGDRRGAVADLDETIDRLQRPSPDLYLRRARLLTDLGERDQALAGLDEARFRLGPVPALEIYAIEAELADGRAAAADARLRALSAVYPNPAPLAGLAARIAAELNDNDVPPAVVNLSRVQRPAAASDETTPVVGDRGVPSAPRPIAAVGDMFAINRGAAWKYLVTPAAPDAGWPLPGYDDMLWPSGPAPLGFGDPGIATTIPFGPDPLDKYPTTYFRIPFTITGPPAGIVSLIMSVDYDDGFVASINGVEVARRGLPPGNINYNMYAANHEGGAYEVIEITAAAGALVEGNNVLAVEVHQTSASSSDLQWDMDLFYTDQHRVTRGPYLQVGTASGVTVRWRTNAPTASRVRYGTSLLDLSGDALFTDHVKEHEVRVEGLLPATRYYYSVGTVAGPLMGDPSYTFVTAPTPGTVSPTRIWVIGDSGLPVSGAFAVRDAYAAWTGARGTDLWLMLGDNAYQVGTDNDYQAGVFDQYPVMLRQAVVWPTRGNHDFLYTGADNDYYDIFTMPTTAQAGGVPSGSEAYYSFDWGDIHFICLDSEGTDRSPGGAMLTWLANDIAASPRRWVIAYWHHPAYTKGSHDSDNEIDSGARMGEMRRNAVPILEAAGVDLVLAGHSHSYERSHLIDSHYGTSPELQPWMIVNNGDGRPNGNGPYLKPIGPPTPHAGEVFAVAGSGSQIGGGQLNHPVMVTSLNLLGSMVLDVNGDRLDARFLDQTGAVMDSFAIIKSATIQVGVNDRSNAPRVLSLGPGMPNPFTARTHMYFTLDRPGTAQLSLVDAAGRRVITLVNGWQEAGGHEVRWDGRDEHGRAIPNGVYLAVLEAGGKRVTRKIACVR